MNRVFCLELTLIFALSAPGAFSQNTVYVDKHAPPGGLDDGSSWSNAYTDLQDALNDAVVNAIAPEDTDILVAEGSYRPTLQLGATAATKTFALDLASAPSTYKIQILGGYTGVEGSTDPPLGSADLTVLRGSIGAGNKRHHVVTILDVVTGSDVFIDGFRIRNGWADGAAGSGDDVGAGLQVLRRTGAPAYGRVTVDHIWFDSNWASSKGGAIFFDESVTGELPHRIRNCRFTNNTAEDGGGIYVSTDTGAVLGNVLFRDNGDPGVVGSQASIRGAGVFMQPGSGHVSIVNGVFFENTAQDAGGAVYFEYLEFGAGVNNDSLELDSCTFVANNIRQTGTGAGAVHLAIPGLSGVVAGSNDPHLQIHNSIMWENVDGGGALADVWLPPFPLPPDPPPDNNFRVDLQHSNFSLPPPLPPPASPPPLSVINTAAALSVMTVSPTSVDPLFVNRAAGNLRLQNGPNQTGGGGGSFSPLIDQGLDVLLNGADDADVDDDSTFNLNVDLDFRGRKLDFPLITGPGLTDLGAYETLPFSPF